MIFENGHADITLHGWQEFRQWVLPSVAGWPSIFEEVIDRSEIGLPAPFIPLARGGAIANDLLLRRAGYVPGSNRPRGWTKIHCDVFYSNVGPKRLMVRRSGKRGLWTIERWGLVRRYEGADEVLVHVFGSTPILTRNYQSAMRLAAHCHAQSSPGLRWINACPEDYEGAIALAEQRCIDEALAEQSAPQEKQLHDAAQSQ
jgi:hypothetical protein